MFVSVIIPACDAQSTLLRALASLRAQTWAAWEAIVVADDRFDYAAFLSGQGFADERLRHATTGHVRSGTHNARNIGLAKVRGDLVAMLDADDLLHPDYLSVLSTVAGDHGAAADNLAVVRETDGALLYRVLGNASEPGRLDLGAFLALSAPLVPVVRRDYALPRLAGIEYAEDVIANLRLIDALGGLPVVPQSLYEYRIVTGSLSNSTGAAEAFDAAYASYVSRLESGDGLALSPANRTEAAQGLADKRALNQAFAATLRREPGLSFQEFAARQHGAQQAPISSGKSSPGSGSRAGRAPS